MAVCITTTRCHFSASGTRLSVARDCLPRRRCLRHLLAARLASCWLQQAARPSLVHRMSKHQPSTTRLGQAPMAELTAAVLGWMAAIPSHLLALPLIAPAA